MYSYLKLPSQVYHRPMPHTKFIYFNITRAKASYAVAYCVVYSAKCIDSVRLSSTLRALLAPTPTTTILTRLVCINLMPRTH